MRVDLKSVKFFLSSQFIYGFLDSSIANFGNYSVIAFTLCLFGFKFIVLQFLLLLLNPLTRFLFGFPFGFKLYSYFIEIG